MKNRIRNIALSGSAAALVLAAVTGCGQARTGDQPQSQSESKKAVQTEAAPAVTEAPIIIETEAPQTEPQTQPQTQPETQLQTQPETQPQTQPETQPQTVPASLSEEEELAQLYEYAEGEAATKYANADMNVRTGPTTNSEDNIVSSLDKGEEITVVGETANWYEIYKAEDSVSGLTDLKAFVMKTYLSDTYDEAMAAQPSESAPAEAAPAEAAPAEAAPAEAAPAEAAPAEAAPAEQTAETSAPAQQVAASSAEGPTVTVNSDANIRADAAVNGEVVGVVSAGTQVTQIGSTAGWVQVDHNGVQGYIKSSMVS